MTNTTNPAAPMTQARAIEILHDLAGDTGEAVTIDIEYMQACSDGAYQCGDLETRDAIELLGYRQSAAILRDERARRIALLDAPSWDD